MLVVIVVLGTSGVVAWALLRPSPCSGRTFVSDRFGYCVDPPSGWAGTLGSNGGWPIDSFVARTSVATVEVAAVKLTTSEDLRAFANRIGELDRTSGLLVGGQKSLEVGGEPALFFDAGAPAPEGLLEVREVLVVRNGVAWRITLTDAANAFDHDLASLHSFLSSWRFR